MSKNVMHYEWNEEMTQNAQIIIEQDPGLIDD